MAEETLSEAGVATCIRTLRLKLKSESYAWLNAAATEVRDVNAAENILSAARCSPSVCGNESSAAPNLG